MSFLVSVIVPCYNAAAHIEETLASLCGQSWSDLEIIVVDDGSRDRSAELVEQFPDKRIRLIRSANGGACRARNLGLEAARGDYIQFIDADDLMDRTKIERQLVRLRQHDAGAVAYGPWWEFTDVPKRNAAVGFDSGRDFERPMEWLFASLEEGFYLPPHCWLVPRAIIERAGPWDVRLRQNQDGEYFSRVLEHASHVAWVPVAFSFYRGGNAGSVSSVKGRAYTESLLLAADMIRDRMLGNLPEDASRGSCIAALYLRILYRVGQSDDEMVSEIWSRISDLGTAPRSLPVGGLKFRCMSRCLGWRLAFRLRSCFEARPRNAIPQGSHHLS